MNLSGEFDEDELSYLEFLILHAPRYGALFGEFLKLDPRFGLVPRHVTVHFGGWQIWRGLRTMLFGTRSSGIRSSG
jgi:hypothetical protein